MISIRNSTHITIFLLWLFHLSGMIGILLGYEQWFYEKTPLNLSACFALFILSFKRTDIKFWMVFLLLMFLGMSIEWLGVHKGWFFGTYSYGQNMGVKLDGIPFIIGIYWAVLAFCGYAISSYLKHKMNWNTWIRLAFGGFLMTLLDAFLEPIAPLMDLWTFIPSAPLENYLSWFVFGTAFQWIIHLNFKKEALEKHLQFSTHLYAVQFIFFGVLILALV